MDEFRFDKHTSQQFDSDLVAVQNHMIEMAGFVEQQIKNSLDIFIHRDVARVVEIRLRDKTANKMEVDITEECMQIVARRQPAAVDLRLLMSVIHSVSDIERIGDEARKISTLSEGMVMHPALTAHYRGVKSLGDMVLTMFRQAIDSFVRPDLSVAYDVLCRDKEVNACYASELDRVMKTLSKNPQVGALNIGWALRSLERIGDHSTNIAEHLIYWILGEDVRHRNLEYIAQHIEDARSSRSA